jgi:hypothetical protein
MGGDPVTRLELTCGLWSPEKLVTDATGLDHI